MDPAFSLAQRIAERLGQVPGVAAVVLGGSRSQGTATSASDIDLGIYYRSDSPLAVARLRVLAAELGNGAEAVTEIGDWGPWINGGAWLEIEGRPVDWIYRDVDRVREVMTQCSGGNTGFHYQPGHPYAFCDHIYLGEIHHCCVLHDPQETIATLKTLTVPYPEALQRTLIDRLWEAEFALATARKAAGRGDGYYVAGCLFRCASIMAQTLFALNERYWLNEKGAVALAGSLPICPPDFTAIIERTMGSVGNGSEELIAGIERMQELTETIRLLNRPTG